MRIEAYNNIFDNIKNMSLCILIKNRVITKEMEKCGDNWFIELDLENGEYLYKFIINNGIRLNDNNAYNYTKWKSDEVWSILKIQDGNIIYGSNREIKLERYSLSPGIRYGYYLSNRTFDLKLDRKFSISIELDKVTDTHSITAVWYREDGSIFHIEEKDVCGTKEDCIYQINVVFWIEFPTAILMSGNWTIEIYIDGKKLIKDYFIYEKKGDKRYVKFNSNIKTNTLYNRFYG